MKHIQRRREPAANAFRMGLVWLFGATLISSNPSLGQCDPLYGDSNNNYRVELQDYASFVSCYAGPSATPQPDPPQSTQSCLNVFDGDNDLDVDLLDFAELQLIFTGTGPIPTQCFNLAFVSSVGFQPNLGSTAAYDAQCNILASAAGLNNPPGNAFIAWVSASNSLAQNRLGQARGFVRPDGVAVADTVNSLLTENVLWNPIRIDELGNDVGTKLVMTGTQLNGSASLTNCTNWTINTNVIFPSGNTSGGPWYWTDGNTAFCNQGPFRIYCIQKTVVRAMTPPREHGKVIYLTNTPFTPGGGLAAADQLCAASKPAGAGTVLALLATAGTSAASRINPFTTFVRVDGQLVGTAIELTTTNLLHSGIWQAGDGSYIAAQAAWTGSTAFSAVGTMSSTCNNWTSAASASSGIAGLLDTTEAPKWWNFFTPNCATPQRLYCVEQ